MSSDARSGSDLPPEADVVEVSVFGPGKGECVLVHLGYGQWVVVDSCMDKEAGMPASLAYLRRIGVDPAIAVKLVVGTHAHDDHITGIAETFRECSEASFVCSAALTTEEFQAVLRMDARMEVRLRESSFSEYRSVFEIIRETKDPSRFRKLKRATESRELWASEPTAEGAKARVIALSPSDYAVTRALEALGRHLSTEASRRKKSSFDPNDASIALWVEVAGKRILLGADLRTGPDGCGWQAILSSFLPSGGQLADVFKVPHHGAPNAHHPDVWQQLLVDSPVALLTQFSGGTNPRPSLEDKIRICDLTDRAYITSYPPEQPRPKRVKEIAADLSDVGQDVRLAEGRCGHVRARSRVGTEDWDIDLFAPARSLCG